MTKHIILRQVAGYYEASKADWPRVRKALRNGVWTGFPVKDADAGAEQLEQAGFTVELIARSPCPLPSSAELDVRIAQMSHAGLPS